MADDDWHFIAVARAGAALTLWQDGALVHSVNAAVDISGTTPVVNVGWCEVAPSVAGLNGLALIRIGASAPSAAQIAKIYADELPMFQPDAKVTLQGSSDAVTDLKSDGGLLAAYTSDGLTTFDGLTVALPFEGYSANRGTWSLSGTWFPRDLHDSLLLSNGVVTQSAGSDSELTTYDGVSSQIVNSFGGGTPQSIVQSYLKAGDFSIGANGLTEASGPLSGSFTLSSVGLGMGAVGFLTRLAYYDHQFTPAQRQAMSLTHMGFGPLSPAPRAFNSGLSAGFGV